ncbi:MAG TPA: TfoX/Sxy family protein [Nitriliruptorales bacterium]|nr:TfoX/Sxy family protein [Nitriliruptorales bacterium]
MAYDEDVASRVRNALADAGVEWREQRMFGGLAFMVRGHMTVGIVGDELMVRVGREAHADALALPYARPMGFTGKPMTGMVDVAARGFAGEADLREWIQRGLAFTQSLPPK